MKRVRREPLLVRLRNSSSSELLQLVEESAFSLSIREVRQILLNPFADGEVVRAIAAIRSLSREYEVMTALARFHRTPEPIALSIMPNLRWVGLLEVALAARVRPVVRRSAERYLEIRLPSLAVGERLTLARRAPAGLLRSLLKDPESSVVNGVLTNRRLTLEHVVSAISRDALSPVALDLIADSRWATSYEVKVVLCRNPQTPFRRILPLLPDLHRSDLRSIRSIEEHSSLILLRVDEQLEFARFSS